MAFNPLAWERSGLVAVSVLMPRATAEVSMLDAKGHVLPSEVRSSNAGTHTFKLLVDVKNAPSLEYEVLHVVPGKRARGRKLDGPPEDTCPDQCSTHKPLSRGRMAIGLINAGESPLPASVNFRKLGYSHAVRVRDLWEKKDVGVFTGTYTATVPKHGVVLIEIQ